MTVSKQNDKGAAFSAALSMNNFDTNDVASILGVSYNCVWNWRKEGVSPKRAVAAARLLKVDPHLICGNPPQRIEKPSKSRRRRPTKASIRRSRAAASKAKSIVAKQPQNPAEVAVEQTPEPVKNSAQNQANSVTFKQYAAVQMARAFIAKGEIDSLGYDGVAKMAARQTDALLSALEG